MKIVGMQLLKLGNKNMMVVLMSCLRLMQLGEGNKMKGIKKEIDHYLKANAPNQVQFCMSKKQKKHHIVVLPKKNIIRLNEEYMHTHKDSLTQILDVAINLIYEKEKPIIYHNLEA